MADRTPRTCACGHAYNQHYNNFVAGTACHAEGCTCQRYSARLAQSWQELYEAAQSEPEAITLLKAENEQLHQRLAVACHVSAEDKEGFDWAILDEIFRLRQQVQGYETVLRNIAHDHATQADIYFKQGWHGLFTWAQDLARAVLKDDLPKETDP